MTMDHVLLLNQCFEVERSKIVIKIENIDIELKPETAEINPQTDESELLGRINVEIEASEPKIIRYDVDVLVEEPKVITFDSEINATEPEIIKFDRGVLVEEPKLIKLDKEILVVEPKVFRFDEETLVKEDEIVKVDRETFIVEQEIIKFDRYVTAKLDEIIKLDKEVLVEEPEVIRLDKELITSEIEIVKLDKEVLVKEPKIIRFNKKFLVKEKQPTRYDKEVLVKEDAIVVVDSKINPSDKFKRGSRDVLSYSVEPETIIIKFNKELLPIDPEIIKLEKNTIPVEYDVYRLLKGKEDNDRDSSHDVLVIKKETENIDLKEDKHDRISLEAVEDIKVFDDLIELFDAESICEPKEENPLLKEYADEHSSIAGTLSSLSSTEFMVNERGVSNLSEEDPKTILTWNVSGLAQTKSRRYVWNSFVQIIKQQDPDIVILQDVKLCSSQILGVTPKLSMRTHGGHVPPSYAQEIQDANLVNDLKRNVFRKYYCIHSLSSWRIAGQLIFVKNNFQEGRSIILQFKSFYLTSLLSPVQGWNSRSVSLRNRWDRELAMFLDNSKSEKASIVIGSLNCAPEDIDLSDPVKLKQEKSIVLHEQGVIGYPGSRDVDREGFKWILDAGNLIDIFRYKHPYNETSTKQKNLKFTTLAFLSDKTRCAVRTDLVLMSKTFLNNVKMCEIIGTDKDLDPSGWRHLPQLLKIQNK